MGIMPGNSAYFAQIISEILTGLNPPFLLVFVESVAKFDNFSIFTK
jgi:hypothetical protein